MQTKNLIIGVIIYVASALAAYILFANFLSLGGPLITPVAEPVKEGERTVFDDSLPKTEECPINGARYSKQQRSWWEKHRPLGIMIENHQEARPQSGISFADVVYEAVAEGGITRFLAVYYCRDAGIVGPIRSARTYFMDFISEYGDYPLYTHVGGANAPGPADALGQIESYGWQVHNDINQFSVGFPTFWRDYERLGHPVATEHTMYSTTEKLWKVGTLRKLTNKDDDGNNWDESFVKYDFKDDETLDKRPGAQLVSFSFWQGRNDYAVEWVYDKTSNNYFRKNGSVSYTDKNTDSQLSAKNVVVLFMRESRANDGYEGNLHLIYGTKGAGNAIVFMDGARFNMTWSKKDRTSKLILKDKAGLEVKFNRGAIWFEVLPIGTAIDVK